VTFTQEKDYIRDLAKHYADVVNDPIQDKRRRVWRSLNSLKPVRPPIYIRAFAWDEVPESKLQCTDPLHRAMEQFFQMELVRSTFNDDHIFEPWYTVDAIHKITGWGVDYKRIYPHEGDGLEAFKVDYAVKDLNDFSILRPAGHEIDEEATKEKFEKTGDLIGDIITVNLDRSPCYRSFSADMSTDLGYLRGMENFMLDMYDNPEGLHRLMKFMSNSILAAHDKAEAEGDWCLTGTYNQAMPYSEELADPKANVSGITRDRIWAFCAAQEFTMVSPEMHEEFLLNYQLPIIEKFGLVSYGCCEDLANKIDMLRKIPNLRRIAASPMADLSQCAENIGRDYVLSYRPSPADMLAYDFDPARCKKILRNDFAILKNNIFDITMKDVQTVDGGVETIRQWVKMVRETLEDQL
jgi:hypothetical protein